MKYAYNADVKDGMNILECISSFEDRLKAKSNYDRAISGESHTTIEEYGDIERSQYESFYNPLLDEEKAIIGVTVFARNITDRKKVERAVNESESLQRLLLENINAGIAIADSGAPIRDNESKIIGVVLVFRDMTEKHKLHESLQQAQKLESLGVLAGGIAHDFNNLLGGIFGYLDMANECATDGKLDKV